MTMRECTQYVHVQYVLSLNKVKQLFNYLKTESFDMLILFFFISFEGGKYSLEDKRHLLWLCQ